MVRHLGTFTAALICLLSFGLQTSTAAERECDQFFQGRTFIDAGHLGSTKYVSHVTFNSGGKEIIERRSPTPLPRTEQTWRRTEDGYCSISPNIGQEICYKVAKVNETTCARFITYNSGKTVEVSTWTITERAASAPILHDGSGPPRPSFDCSSAKTASARLICADPELAKLDAELGKTFQNKKSQLGGAEQKNFITEEIAWIKTRNAACGLVGKDGAPLQVLESSKACMEDAIRKRLADLSGDLHPPSTSEPNTIFAESDLLELFQRRGNPECQKGCPITVGKNEYVLTALPSKNNRSLFELMQTASDGLSACGSGGCLTAFLEAKDGKFLVLKDSDPTVAQIAVEIKQDIFRFGNDGWRINLSFSVPRQGLKGGISCAEYNLLGSGGNGAVLPAALDRKPVILINFDTEASGANLERAALGDAFTDVLSKLASAARAACQKAIATGHYYNWNGPYTSAVPQDFGVSATRFMLFGYSVASEHNWVISRNVFKENEAQVQAQQEALRRQQVQQQQEQALRQRVSTLPLQVESDSTRPNAQDVANCIKEIQTKNSCPVVLTAVRKVDRLIEDSNAVVIADADIGVLQSFAGCSPNATNCTGTCWDMDPTKVKVADGFAIVQNEKYFRVGQGLRIEKKFLFKKFESGWRCITESLQPVDKGFYLSSPVPQQ